MKGMCSATYMHSYVHYNKSANKLIRFDNNEVPGVTTCML